LNIFSYICIINKTLWHITRLDILQKVSIEGDP
jgi:hypothetical protein